MVQECLNNIVKHSHPTATDMMVHRPNDGITLVVSENGVGFAAGADEKAAVSGLLGFRRARDCCAAKRQSCLRRGAGTTIIIEIETEA